MRQGRVPGPDDARDPGVAAVCVYPAQVPVVHAALRGTGVNIASVSTGFPAGQTSLDIKLGRPGGGRRGRATRSTW